MRVRWREDSHYNHLDSVQSDHLAQRSLPTVEYDVAAGLGLNQDARHVPVLTGDAAARAEEGYHGVEIFVLSSSCPYCLKILCNLEGIGNTLHIVRFVFF